MGDMNALEAILSRRTSKVLVDPDKPWEVTGSLKEFLPEILLAAESAPFHYPAHRSHKHPDHDSPVPWRIHCLDGEGCRQLLKIIRTRDVAAGKIPAMLAAAEYLALTTWLPTPGDPSDNPGQYFDPTLENMEHIAAASAAIQNMLIAATARGVPNYWSSGGLLREEEWMKRLDIPASQILLGAIFFFPREETFPHRPMEIAPGKMRSQKGKQSSWVRFMRPMAENP